jgi:hypothetical protein
MSPVRCIFFLLLVIVLIKSNIKKKKKRSRDTFDMSRACCPRGCELKRPKTTVTVVLGRGWWLFRGFLRGNTH